MEISQLVVQIQLIYPSVRAEDIRIYNESCLKMGVGGKRVRGSNERG
jgi:hypothetical protein